MAFMNRKVLALGAGIGLAVLLVQQARKLLHRHHAENVLDDALGETFPASDPTATQDYAVPVNRL
jgi:hypothetical protein